MNFESGKNSYRVALESASADLAEIQEKIDQLNVLRERIEKAADALKWMLYLHEMTMGAVPQPIAVVNSTPEVENRRHSEPLFGSSFRPVAQINSAPENFDSELRPLAALA